jgi:hypothetical protein
MKVYALDVVLDFDFVARAFIDGSLDVSATDPWCTSPPKTLQLKSLFPWTHYKGQSLTFIFSTCLSLLTIEIFIFSVNALILLHLLKIILLFRHFTNIVVCNIIHTYVHYSYLCSGLGGGLSEKEKNPVNCQWYNANVNLPPSVHDWRLL